MNRGVALFNAFIIGVIGVSAASTYERVSWVTVDTDRYYYHSVVKSTIPKDELEGQCWFTQDDEVVEFQYDYESRSIEYRCYYHNVPYMWPLIGKVRSRTIPDSVKSYVNLSSVETEVETSSIIPTNEQTSP